jgi:glycosyltransferase involved in cell wall biosynthesis
MRTLIDGRPVRFPLAGVGQYVRNLGVALADAGDPDLDFSMMLMDGIGDSNHEARRLHETLGSGRSHLNRVVPRRALTAALRYAPRAVPATVLGGAFDLWHSTYFEGYPSLRRGQHLVSTVHDIIFVDHPELFAPRNLSASRWALDRQVRDSDVLICVSEFTKQQLLLKTAASPEQIRVIPLAVSVAPLPSEVAQAERQRAGIDRPYVLYIGNLEPRKDVPTMLRAWLASDARHDFTLVLAGAPAYLSEATLSAIGEAAEQADIRSLGYVSEGLKAALLSGAEAFVYPSTYEGFGIPVLEALTYGVPVVACQTSSIPEVTGAGGLLVPVGDSDSMRDAIDTLLSDQRLRLETAAAGKRHAAKFSWSRVARDTTDAYRHAVQAN